MDENWEVCFAETEKWEGWHQFSDNPHDPGGATYSGVTQRAYDGYRRLKGLKPESVSVRRMTDQECRDLYRVQYWIPCRGPDLPDGLDLCQYDECVNCGPVEAAKLLQEALGIAPDGVFGLETYNAVKRNVDIPGLIERVSSARLGFYHRLKTWAFFGVGWSRRDVGIRAKALAMYAARKEGAQ